MLLRSLSPSKILSVFGALVRERRILVVSNDLHRLSASIFALLALLRPFAWQHIFIPILSNNLLSYCCAPMPFLIGIHASLYDQVLKLPLEEVRLLSLHGHFRLGFDDSCRLYL
jgi:hypothetical protein